MSAEDTKIAGVIVGLGFAAVPAAIGAAVADRHPATGAFVGTAIMQSLLGLAASSWGGPVGGAAVAAIGTAIVGSGAVLGAHAGGRHPAVGAAIGAGATGTVGYLLLEARRKAREQERTGVSGHLGVGAPRIATRNVEIGAFP